MNESLLRYYHEELSYLREQAAHFAQAHPKVAGRLRLGPGAADDPFVGRLTESFAFLAARIRNKSDQQLGVLSEALLNLLYPHYLLPIPALGIIQLIAHEQLTKAHTIAAGTKLSSRTTNGEQCFFTTNYPVTIWPIKLSQLHLTREPSIKLNQPNHLIKSCLSLSLQCSKPELSFNELKPDTLRFYIKLSAAHCYQLYDLLFTQVQEIRLSHPQSDGQGIRLDKSALKQVGFNEPDALLPYPAHSFSGYRLLTEYFAFPEKFLFFDITGLSDALANGFNNEVQIHLLLKQAYPELESILEQNSLLLNCSPMINLFAQTAEPLTLNHQQYEYHLIADAQQKMETLEIYRIEKISVLGQSNVECLPYFGRKYASIKDTEYLYWQAQRKPLWELGAHHVPGTEMFISFSEPNHKLPTNCILSAQLLCSNRDLPTQLAYEKHNLNFALWQSNALISEARCVSAITAAKYRNRDKLADHELIAHIALSQMSFTDAEDTLNTLKEVLALYHYDDPHSQDMIQQGLCQASIRHCTERYPSNLQYGFCQGIDLNLVIDEQYLVPHSAFLFGSILAVFFAKSCAINTFTRLTLSSKQRGVIHQWQPIFGHKPTL